ncbi:MAG: hypothetical protein GKC09_06050 [Methanosarcinales archaeon]|jgi:hypothetical protein|uniref:hypothetical protein n=1 Tax=Methanothrix TaxID=2222 RepID=UPI0017CEC7CC|nr:hypothetical protein [Methanosaeta sp. UBA356]NYT09487.1 hypothetical protein [Methanosarcinales archaeon]
MKNWIIVFALTNLLFPIPALAESGTIDVDVGDMPVSISGWIEEENAFTGNIRLTANGSDINEFLFIASDLKPEEGDRIIGRQNVAILGDLNLKKGVPKNFHITISNVKDPGIYRGWIELLLPDNKKSQFLNLTLMAKSRPKLTLLPGIDKISLKLVNSDDILAKLVLPAAAFTDRWEIQIDNPTMVDVNVTSSSIALTGEKTGYQLTKKSLSLPYDEKILPANKISVLNLTLNRMEIPADSYSGNIYLIMKGSTDRLTIPIAINTRIGPWRAVLALFFGIILGWLFRYAQKKEPQSKALKYVYRLESDIRKTDPGDQQILLPMIEKVRGEVYKEKLETVQAELKAIEARMQTLKELREIEKNLKTLGNNDYVGQIDSIRHKIKMKKDEDAKNDLEGLLKALRGTLDMGQEGPKENLKVVSSANEAAQASKRAKEAAEGADELKKQGGQDAIQQLQQKLKNSIIKIANNSDQFQAETALWILPPLLYLILLLLSLAMGFRSEYIEKGLTFGTNPFGDYMSLILWGITTDIAVSGINGLIGKKEGSTPG